MFASIFPNLQLLDLSFRRKYMRKVSEEINCHVLMRSCKFMHLSFAYCSRVKLLRPKLKVLNLSNTMVDDETLYVITTNCCGIFQLLLKNCYNVTEKGVKYVLENCTQLREINLHNCNKIDPEFVDSMVFIRSSLRKITAPPFFSCSDNKRKLFLRHGCLLF
jgi:F-box and leucine-rich repeat protein 2/20